MRVGDDVSLQGAACVRVADKEAGCESCKIARGGACGGRFVHIKSCNSRGVVLRDFADCTVKRVDDLIGRVVRYVLYYVGVLKRIVYSLLILLAHLGFHIAGVFRRYRVFKRGKYYDVYNNQYAHYHGYDYTYYSRQVVFVLALRLGRMINGCPSRLGIRLFVKKVIEIVHKSSLIQCDIIALLLKYY